MARARPVHQRQRGRGRIWKAHGLQPHRNRQIKLLELIRNFVDKLRDVVGLYVYPPDHAIVLSSTRRAKSRPSTAPSRVCR